MTEIPQQHAASIAKMLRRGKPVTAVDIAQRAGSKCGHYGGLLAARLIALGFLRNDGRAKDGTTIYVPVKRTTRG